MPDDVTENDGLMMIAARLRAEGATWQEVGEAVGRAEDTVEAWARKRPDEWYPALQAAVNELLPECEREAVHVLRQGLREKTAKEKRLASSALLRHIRECRAKLLTFGVGEGGGLQIVITPAVKPEEEGE